MTVVGKVAKVHLTLMLQTNSHFSTCSECNNIDWVAGIAIHVSSHFLRTILSIIILIKNSFMFSFRRERKRTLQLLLQKGKGVDHLSYNPKGPRLQSQV